MATQTWQPERYLRNAGFVAQLGLPVVELLQPRPGERILDLGCGEGQLTEALVAAGCQVVGVDSSAEQIAAARKRGPLDYILAIALVVAVGGVAGPSLFLLTPRGPPRVRGGAIRPCPWAPTD